MNQLALLGSLALLTCCSAALAFGPPWRERELSALLVFLVAGGAWCVAIGVLRRSPDDARALRIIWIGAIVLRALALCANLELSDDGYRHVFEGELLRSGRSPYAHAPAAPELAELRVRMPELFERINHPGVPAAYPPLTQALGLATVLGARVLGLSSPAGALLGLRVAMALVDLAVLYVLVRLLRSAGKPATACVALAWCPLLVFESAGSAHVDTLGVLGLLLALAAWRSRPAAHRRDEWLGTVSFTFGTLVKYLPLLVLPWFLRERRPLGRLLGVVALGVLCFLPFLALEGGGRGLSDGLRTYAERWQAGSLVFRGLEWIAARNYQPEAGWGDPTRIARLWGAGLWGAWAVFVFVRVRSPLRAAGLVLGAFLVLTPTLHPWYLTWIAPFVALRGSRAWTWMLAAAPLLYTPLVRWQVEAEWVEPAWMWPVLALPFFALLALDGARSGLFSRSPRALAQSADA